MTLSRKLCAKLKKDGYVASNTRIESPTIENLSLLYSKNAPNLTGFHTSFNLDSVEDKRTVNNRLKLILQPHINRLFPNYRIEVANFVVKEPSQESYLPFHRDWSVVDETRFCSYNVWFPLVDLNDENGVIGFCKGTHKHAPLYRSPTNPAGLIQTSPELEKEVEFQYVKAGQLLVFNHATIHCSKANNSSAARIAVTAVIVPKAAQGYHYYFETNGSEMATYEVDEEFYLQYQIGSPIPDGLKKHKRPQIFNLKRLVSYFKW